MRLGYALAFAQDQETFFNEALMKWKELNCTLDFVGFHRDVRQKANSLAQLLYHKVRTYGIGWCVGILA